MTQSTSAGTADEHGGSKTLTPDRDATVKVLKKVALILYVVKHEYCQAVFDAIELITGEKTEEKEEARDE